MHPLTFLLRGRHYRRLLMVLLGLLYAGCAGQERACSVDGTCPPNTVCIDKVCKNVPWWSDVTSLMDVSADTACDPKTGSTSTTNAVAGSARVVAGWVQDRLVMYGGDSPQGGRCKSTGAASALSVSWAPCDGWRTTVGQRPPARSAGAGASGMGSLWLMGGWRRTTSTGAWILSGDLWRFGSGVQQWTRVTQQTIPVRHSAALAVQDSPPSVWVFGGDAGTTSAASIFLFDLRRYRFGKSLWEVPLVKGKAPGGRAEHNLVAIAGGKQLLLFGGRSKAGLLGDLWLLDTDKLAWTKLPDSAVAPSPRRGAQMVVTHEAVWLFGGHDASAQGFRNDLWRMPLSSLGKWQRLKAGDLGKGATTGGVLLPLTDPCTPPAGFAQLDPTSPPRRSHGILTAHGGALWLRGGQGECGALGDIWRLDTATVTWSIAHGDESGWSCERRGTTCAALCGP